MFLLLLICFKKYVFQCNSDYRHGLSCTAVSICIESMPLYQKLRTFALRSLPNTIDVFPTAVGSASSKVRKLLCADWLPQKLRSCVKVEVATMGSLSL